MTEIPKAIWKGSFTLFGVEIKCATLDNGQRIIEAESVEKLFRAMAENSDPGEDFAAFSNWQMKGTT